MKNEQGTESVSSLLRENRKLRHENKSLKLQLEAITKGRSYTRKHDRFTFLFDKAAKAEYLYSKKSYLSYVAAHIKGTSVFELYKRLINAIRRYTFITTSLKVASFVFAIIETGAVLVLSTSALIITVPLSLFISQLFALSTLFVRKKQLVRHKSFIQDKNVYILFPSKRYAFDKRSYFYGFTSSLASESNTRVIIVSPYSVNATGLGNSKNCYFISRSDGDRILLIRKHYYFSLKSQVASKYAASLTEIF